MKIRRDFVTNSSSSSYIICFARIDNEIKAKKILDRYKIIPLTTKDVDSRKCYGELGADWCNAIIYNADNIMNHFPNSKYIIIEDWIEADYDEDGDPIYDYEFSKNDIINEINEENGFANVEISQGQGRNG